MTQGNDMMHVYHSYPDFPFTLSAKGAGL